MIFLIRRAIIAIIFFGILGTIIMYGRGYRLDFNQQTVGSTGIINATSSPDGAKIFINGQLKAATNQNITLAPGNYTIRIEKEGYSPWEKSATLKGEWVIKAHAILYPINPSLIPVTTLGITTAASSPSGDKTIIVSQKGDPLKDGIYQLDSTKRPIPLANQLKLLAIKSKFDSSLDLSQAEFTFSPDEKEILVALDKEQPTTQKKISTTPSTKKYYLLTVNEEKQSPFEVTQSFANILQAWESEKMATQEKTIKTLKAPLQKLALDGWDDIRLSPDGKKFLYQAKVSMTIPDVIKPKLPGTNQTPESRDIKEGSWYVYDKEEDKNYLISVSQPATPTITKAVAKTTQKIVAPIVRPTIYWHPNSMNIIYDEDNILTVIDYDNTNKRTLYSGPFEKNFLAISDDGNLLILANLNPKINEQPDIYAVGIK